MNFIGQSFAWFAGLLVFMSFVEHQIHCNMMHKKTFLADLHRKIRNVFEHHAILHHGEYRAVFSDAPRAKGEDRGIQLSLKEGFIEALPVSALIAIVSWQGAIMLEIVVCLHHLLWNKIHLEMHQPKPSFFSSWPVYKFLARHHYLHHRYPNRNFNVVLPIADYVLGTNIHASKDDLENMRLAGLL